MLAIRFVNLAVKVSHELGECIEVGSIGRELRQMPSQLIRKPWVVAKCFCRSRGLTCWDDQGAILRKDVDPVLCEPVATIG